MGVGPQIPLIWPFAIYVVIVTFGLWAILNFIVGKYLIYSGPEDDEEWDEANHFTVKSDDPKNKKVN